MLKKMAILSILMLFGFGVLMLTTQQATFVVENTQEVAIPAPKVWKTVSQVDLWPQWWPGVEKAELPRGWEEGAEFHLSLQGQTGSDSAYVVTFAPRREISWAREGVLGSTGRTRLRLSSANGGTMVILENTIEGPQAVLARVTGRGEFEKYQEAALESLRRYLEEGESLSGIEEQR